MASLKGRDSAKISIRPRVAKVLPIQGSPLNKKTSLDNVNLVRESPPVSNASSSVHPAARVEKPAAESHHAELTDSIYDALLKAGQAHYCHRDDGATVLAPVPMTEFHQKNLIRATIDSAKRFAIIASYNINPLKDNEPNKISATMFAILESLAKRQSDNEFSFVLLYNENKLHNSLVSSFIGQNPATNMTLQSKDGAAEKNNWLAVVAAYNHQQSDEGLKIRKMDCKVYFVPAKAKGLAGSHHNKFCINDTGVAATLGASIANKTKDSWLDSGCVMISQRLAAAQRDYFLNELVGGHKVHCGQLQADSQGNLVVKKLKNLFALESLRDLPVQVPAKFSTGATDSWFHQAFASAGMSLSGAQHKVLWIQSPSDGYNNMVLSRGRIEDKPIGYAISAIFAAAEKGDTINIANKNIGNEGVKLITDALRKGCDVNVLIDQSTRARLERAVDQFFSRRGGERVGRINVRHFLPTSEFAHSHGLNESLKPVVHSKVYILDRFDNTKIVMTGTYNLNGQSHYRSSENAMLFETRDDTLIKGLFRDVYDGCISPINSWPVAPSGLSR